MSDGTLWDHTEAIAARDEALSRVEVKSAPWRAVAMEALEALCRDADWITSDDVWARLDAMGIGRPIEGRAMGPVMLAAARSGLLRPDGFTAGRDPRHHHDVARRYRVVR